MFDPFKINKEDLSKEDDYAIKKKPSLKNQKEISFNVFFIT